MNAVFVCPVAVVGEGCDHVVRVPIPARQRTDDGGFQQGMPVEPPECHEHIAVMMLAGVETDRAEDFTDPRNLGGDVAGPGGPHDHDQTVVETSRAVLLDFTEFLTIQETTSDRKMLGFLMHGRINHSQDRARVLFLTDADGLAAMVTQALALAGRVGVEYQDRVIARMRELGAFAGPKPKEDG